MIYGYIRVSTEQQHLQNQSHEIGAFAAANKIKIDKWITETVSSRKPLNERKLCELLHQLQKGDILIATELSRLGRNLLEVMSILQQCLEKECQVWTLKENYRLGADIQSKVLAFAFGLASEIERQLISERTRESLKRVKAEGKQLGRPRGSTYRKLAKDDAKVKELLARHTSKAEIARILHCDWNTVHRYIKEFCAPAPLAVSFKSKTPARKNRTGDKNDQTRLIRRRPLAAEHRPRSASMPAVRHRRGFCSRSRSQHRDDFR